MNEQLLESQTPNCDLRTLSENIGSAIRERLKGRN